MNRQTANNGLELYQASKKLVLACYELTHDLPIEEKTNFSLYIRRASLNFHLNIAQAVLLAKKRKKRLADAEKALTVLDAAMEIIVEVELCSRQAAVNVISMAANCRQLIKTI